MKNQNITFETLTGENIIQCKDLCNELMAYQKSKATIAKEAFDAMNFETRMKPSYEKAAEAKVIIAKDNGKPVGYVFSTIDEFTPQAGEPQYPAWAPVKEGEKMHGFTPDWLITPQRTGALSNLYIHPAYRSIGLGAQLFNMSEEWMNSFDDVKYTFIYVSNGNDNAFAFYKNHGYTFSHDVFGGFIKAMYHAKP